MATIFRVRAIWTGGSGLPGYSNFYFGPGGGSLQEAVDISTATVRAAFLAIQNMLPASIGVQVDSEVPMFDEETGDLIDVWAPTTPVTNLQGNGVGTYSAASGASITWLTGEIRDGRRLRGRTYLVPLSTTQYEANGTLVAGALTGLAAFGAVLRGNAAPAGPFLVWGRPSPLHPVGQAAAVTGQVVRDRVSILTSRRD